MHSFFEGGYFERNIDVGTRIQRRGFEVEGVETRVWMGSGGKMGIIFLKG
jgi:hypothetical protein